MNLNQSTFRLLSGPKTALQRNFSSSSLAWASDPTFGPGFAETPLDLGDCEFLGDKSEALVLPPKVRKIGGWASEYLEKDLG